MHRFVRLSSRYSLLARKSIWRVLHDHSPNAAPCYVLGVQRSGTTMILQCLDQSLEIDVLGEGSRAMALDGNHLKADSELKELIHSTRHRFIVFKPLLDSHRGPELLDQAPNGKILWVFRRAEDRANSAVAMFGENNLKLLSSFKSGQQLDVWQAQGLTDENMELIRSFDYTTMSPHMAAAIFWYVRNSLFFSTGLDAMNNVLPVAYEDLACRPAEIMPGICKFIGCDYDEKMIKEIHNRSIGLSPSRLDERIDSLCSLLYDRLHSIWTCKLDPHQGE